MLAIYSLCIHTYTHTGEGRINNIAGTWASSRARTRTHTHTCTHTHTQYIHIHISTHALS